MLCRHCGATTSAALDRCEVCRTPNPAREPATAAGPDSELTWSSSGTVSDAAFPGSGTTRLQPGQEFGRRYTIIRLLGSGGMGEVYHAWDGTLGAAVALKLIRADPGAPALERRDLEARFKRELKLARQVTHPNVVLHDLGEVDDTLYLTMEYVQGADLATLLQREPALPLTRALALARQIASGLALAHRAGIVHRDLKPANVMVDALGHAQLMDFGIARSTSAASVHTMPGSVVGTMDYMAPEQARGEPADERADVYAFGLILTSSSPAGGRSRARTEGCRASWDDWRKGRRLCERSFQTFHPPRADREQVPVFERGGTTGPPTSSSRISKRSTTRDADSQPGERVPLGPRRGAPAARHWPDGRNLGRGTARATTAARGARPLPVLVVDFENHAGESIFDGALEQALSIAMEGAPFITAFPGATRQGSCAT